MAPFSPRKNEIDTMFKKKILKKKAIKSAGIINSFVGSLINVSCISYDPLKYEITSAMTGTEFMVNWWINNLWEKPISFVANMSWLCFFVCIIILSRNKLFVYIFLKNFSRITSFEWRMLFPRQKGAKGGERYFMCPDMPQCLKVASLADSH